jgi:tetratricopeptide (TPR) repeat protein
VEALRAANDRPGAEAAVRAFTQANPGTEAAAAAWTALTTAAEPAQAARYFARAWQASPSLGGQTTALLALARAHVDGRNLWAADAAVQVLLDADPTQAATPEVVALREQLRRARRAPPEAGDSPLARQLAIGARNPFDATAAVRFDARGDGDAVWYAVRSAERLLEPIHGGPAIGLPCDRRVYTGARAGAPGVLACQTGKDIALFVLRDGALVEVARRPDDRLVDLATADVDGDGVTETYVAALRTLLRVEFDDGAATWTPAEPDTHAAGSVLTGVTPCDLDQDGRTELAVAVAEWGLYDVRLLTADPATGGLRVFTRTKLGTTGEIRPWRGPDGPGLAVVKADLWASRQVWPEGQERGQPAGIWLLGADGGRLTPLHRLDRSHPGWQPPLRAADLDGDGVDELAIFERGTTTIYQLQAGAWRSFHLPDTGLHAAGDIDGDGDDELLVSFTDSKQAWWLGTGTPALPPPPAPTIPDVQVDAGHEARFSSTWRRAATLARVGLIQEAGDAFAEIAMVTSDPGDRAEALRTAATLLGLAGDTEAATASWRSLAEAEGGADTWAQLARASITGNDPDSERAAYLKLRALDPDNAALANADALKALDGPVLTANLAAPLTAPWRMPSAVGIRHDTTAGALHVDALPSVLLELPLQPAPDGLRIEVELTADQVEWSGSIGFNLEDDEGSVVMGLGIGGTGGGGVVVPRMFAVPRDGPAAPHHLALGAPVRMSATWSTARGYMVFESEHAGMVRRSVIEVPPPDPSRPLWLRVRAADAGELPRVRATIRRITVTGAAARDGLNDPYPERLRAAAGLAVRPPADDADGLAAWRAASGDFAGALAGVRGRPWDAGVVAWGLRTAPQGWARAVLEADPTRGITALASVWQASITAGADQRAMALDTLAGLERRPVPSTPEAREALAALLELRVTALLDNQQPLLAADALAALDRVLALTPHLRSSRDAILSTRVALAMGRPDDAARLLDQALRDAPSPTLLADRLLVHPGLRALHGSPAWDRVRAYAFLPPTAATP